LLFLADLYSPEISMPSGKQEDPFLVHQTTETMRGKQEARSSETHREKEIVEGKFERVEDVLQPSL